jgi:hypothetical protein
VPLAFKEAQEGFAGVVAAPKFAAGGITGQISLDGGGSADLELSQSWGAGPIGGRCRGQSQNGTTEVGEFMIALGVHPPGISYECQTKRVTRKAFCKCMKTIGDILFALWCCGAGRQTVVGMQIGGVEGRKYGHCRKYTGYGLEG